MNEREKKNMRYRRKEGVRERLASEFNQHKTNFRYKWQCGKSHTTENRACSIYRYIYICIHQIHVSCMIEKYKD